jgi:RNA polymerase sigma factor (sigma-70 family)
MPQPVSLEDVVISDELLSRRIRTLHPRVEIKAMYELANLLPQGAHLVLKRLAQLAVELCDAGSGGISMLEARPDGDQHFRWRALAGELEKFEGGTTPREWSPCGQSLKSGKPMLYLYPARFFTYFQEIDLAIVEGLVIPMYADGQPIGSIWICSHDEQRHFDAEDVRIMSSLGSFVAAAVRLAFTRGNGLGHPPRTGQSVVWGELVRRIAGGDSSALGALMDETKPVVFSTTLRILSFRADAEEIAMDVYSRVWSNSGSYDPERGDVLAWLLSMARSRAIDLLRSRTRQQRSCEALYSECSGAANLEDDAACVETSRDIHRALQALPFEQQEAIELAYFKGYSMSEVASRLGLPVGTVKSRVRYGLMRLRRLMATAEIHRPLSTLN